MEHKTSITQKELEYLKEEAKHIIILDVRTEQEYNEKHIPGAINFPVDKIEEVGYKLAIDTIIITACGKGGGRSERAAQIIRANTANKVYFLEGGTFGYLDNH